MNQGDDFYLVCSKDYDRDIDILHSGDMSFNGSIKRKFEPGNIKVYDSKLFKNNELKFLETGRQFNEESERGLIKIIMKVGEYLYFDTVDLDKCYNEQDPT